MQFSKRTEYALRALIAIGVAEEVGRKNLRLVEIGEIEGIPIPFLEQILAQLRAAGFLRGKRGPTGGYSLARPASEIRMGDIIREVEGELGPLGCVEGQFDGQCSCPHPERCSLRNLANEAHLAMTAVFDRRTLVQTVTSNIDRLRRDQLPVPFSRVECQKNPEFPLHRPIS